MKAIALSLPQSLAFKGAVSHMADESSNPSLLCVSVSLASVCALWQRKIKERKKLQFSPLPSHAVSILEFNGTFFRFTELFITFRLNHEKAVHFFCVLTSEITTLFLMVCSRNNLNKDASDTSELKRHDANINHHPAALWSLGYINSTSLWDQRLSSDSMHTQDQCWY